MWVGQWRKWNWNHSSGENAESIKNYLTELQKLNVELLYDAPILFLDTWSREYLYVNAHKELAHEFHGSIIHNNLKLEIQMLIN
jgi:hypothetical protein